MEIPKEYGTEAYAVCLAKEEQEWHKQYDALINKKIQLFDKLVCMHTEDAYTLIEKIVDDAMTGAVQNRSTEYGFLVILVQIYKAEKNAGESHFLFDCGDSLGELIAIIQQVKFLLWELEFLQEEESAVLFRQYVQGYDMCPELLRNFIKIACMDKKAMCALVGNILEMEL